MTKKPRRQAPPYLQGVLRATQDAKPGDVVHVAVEHDASCSVQHGQDLCTCRASVRKVIPS